ncbi:MAG TPA: hypothetical protein VN324_06780, partial [Quisquiliibacterium sp.]|nr:hypothetical protein [Quisquiliibacterium sp.]
MLHSIDTFEGWHQVVFSLFGRKDKPDARRTRGGLPVRIPDSTLRGPATLPSVEAQRELARRTAEKIDRIESEMIDAPVSVTRPETATRPMPATVPMPGPQPHQHPHQHPAARSQPSTSVPVSQAPAAVHAAASAPSPSPELEPLEFERRPQPAQAAAAGIEVAASSLPPELEEAAILYANGQPQAAAATLRAALARTASDAHGLQAWRMLFDVLQAIGARAEFEAVALEYAARFEKSPPAWQEIIVETAAPRRAGGSAVVALPETLDAAVHARLEAAKRAAANRRAVGFDFTAVRAVDPQGAALVVTTIAEFEKAGRELSVNGAARLCAAARAAIESGRRDPGDGCWQLALLALRLVGDRQAFDDLSIDYCVTYEVSPPPWEPLPGCIRSDAVAVGDTGAGRGQGDAPAVQASLESGDHAGGFALRGEIVGRMVAELESLREWAGA